MTKLQIPEQTTRNYGRKIKNKTWISRIDTVFKRKTVKTRAIHARIKNPVIN